MTRYRGARLYALLTGPLAPRLGAFLRSGRPTAGDGRSGLGDAPQKVIRTPGRCQTRSSLTIARPPKPRPHGWRFSRAWREILKPPLVPKDVRSGPWRRSPSRESQLRSRPAQVGAPDLGSPTGSRYRRSVDDNGRDGRSPGRRKAPLEVSAGFGSARTSGPGHSCYGWGSMVSREQSALSSTAIT